MEYSPADAAGFEPADAGGEIGRDMVAVGDDDLGIMQGGCPRPLLDRGGHERRERAHRGLIRSAQPQEAVLGDRGRDATCGRLPLTVEAAPGQVRSSPSVHFLFFLPCSLILGVLLFPFALFFS